jgi:outer membrane protein assembly factor BamD
VEPILKSIEEIDFFLKKFPESEYTIDLKFKKDLAINQMAAKELYIAKYYISVKKWIPAINRLKKIISDYDKTIFIEEALHRLVEIHYHIGLEDEAKKYAKILGYNYNSSKWFEQTYVILNKDYKLPKTNDDNDKDSFLKKIIKKIR